MKKLFFTLLAVLALASACHRESKTPDKVGNGTPTNTPTLGSAAADPKALPLESDAELQRQTEAEAAEAAAARAKAAATKSDSGKQTPTGPSLDQLATGSWGVQVYAASSLSAAGDYIGNKGLSGTCCVVVKDEMTYAVVWTLGHQTFATSGEATKVWREQPVAFRNKFPALGKKGANSPFVIYLGDIAPKNLWQR